MLNNRNRLATFAFSESQGSGANRLDVAVLALFVLFGIVLSLLDYKVAAVGLLGIALLAGIAAPRAAVAAIPLAIPFIHRPVSIGSGEWSLLELAIVMGSAAVGIRLLYTVVGTKSIAQFNLILKPYSITVAALLLIAVGIASLFTVADTRYLPESVRELRWVIVEPVAAFLLFRWLILLGQGRSLLLTALIGTGVVVAGVGIVQLITQSGVVVADGVERATGPYSHPNNLALYLDRVAVLALAFAVTLRQRSKAIVAVAVICGIGLAATLSRGAALAYLAGAFWIVGAAKVRHGWRWIATGAGIAVLLLAYVGGQRLTDKGSAGTASSRELIWTASIHMIEDNLVTGIGLDQFYNQYGRRYVEPAGWPERYTSHPHNIVLDIWLRLGLAGLAAFGVLAFVLLRVARLPVVGAENRTVWIGAIGALVAGAAHGLLDNGYFLPDLAVLTWLMIALIESSVSLQGEHQAVTYG